MTNMTLVGLFSDNIAQLVGVSRQLRRHFSRPCVWVLDFGNNALLFTRTDITTREDFITNFIKTWRDTVRVNKFATVGALVMDKFLSHQPASW